MIPIMGHYVSSPSLQMILSCEVIGTFYGYAAIQRDFNRLESCRQVSDEVQQSDIHGHSEARPTKDHGGL